MGYNVNQYFVFVRILRKQHDFKLFLTVCVSVYPRGECERIAFVVDRPILFFWPDTDIFKKISPTFCQLPIFGWHRYQYSEVWLPIYLPIFEQSVLFKVVWLAYSPDLRQPN